ncbi:MAG: type III-B CRISPR-associated protein Cas10/Cmr2 [Synechococcales bacterium]|nr:type III-B CRISPR-associated protein Cas10/Cmr2 [Synechococcales bacterium]
MTATAPNQLMPNSPLPPQQIQVAIAWCLLDAAQRNHSNLAGLRNYFYHAVDCDSELQAIVTAVQAIPQMGYPNAIADLKTLTDNNPILWKTAIGLVYGGATKIKPYVFDVPKLHEIRGASALLDNINLVDLPAFFQADRPFIHGNPDPRFTACGNAGAEYCDRVRQWLADNGFGELQGGLIPELILYSTGGNILAFCPPELIHLLADAIEKRYTTETLTANSCAVGATFKPLEIRFGLLPETITEDLFWLEKAQRSADDELVQAYLKIQKNAPPEVIQKAFQDRKSFNELVSKLAILFNQRRAGNNMPERSTTRRYPPALDTHPYLRRDHAARQIAVLPTKLPKTPWHSEVSARKRIMGQIAKRDDTSQAWYQGLQSRWNPNPKAESWVQRFLRYLQRHPEVRYYRKNLEDYLEKHPVAKQTYQEGLKVLECQTVGEIGNASQPDKYIGYIYADGNNMGGYIQSIKTPEEYRQFSEDVSRITENAVYAALAQHLTIHQLQHFNDADSSRNNGDWVHPFEIITIGGDDVLLIVPGDRALQIAQTIGEVFERELANHPQYQIHSDRPAHSVHRYKPTIAHPANSQLSMSTGVLITAEDTPLTYAEDLTNQLLKSAKEKAKILKKQGYSGGTIDFLVLKSVTMICSSIKEFRTNGLVKTYANAKTHTGDRPKDLHLYATPYTLHEIGGLIQLIQSLKAVDFPRSQLYQIRSFLEKGKRTAILNYRYFRVRLKKDWQNPLIQQLEEAWCTAKENEGNLAPWIYYADPEESSKSYYETIWREMVDLYEFIPKESAKLTAEIAVGTKGVK